MATAQATGVIIGRVVDADSHAGIAGARIQLLGARSGARLMEADDAGRFLFANLPAATYRIEVTALGYVDARYGQTGPPTALSRNLDVNHPLELADGQTRRDVTISLWRQGAITGRVADERGEPQTGIAIHLTPVSDAWMGRLVAPMPERSAVTDDRGIYRADAAPGDYILSVGSSIIAAPAQFVADYAQSTYGPQSMFDRFTRLRANGVFHPFVNGLRVGDLVLNVDLTGPPFWLDRATGHLVIYPPMYYPSAVLSREAAVISVKSGEERAGVDFQLRPATTFQVSGRVIGPSGPVAGLGVRLTGADWDRTGSPAVRSDAPEAVTDATGAFTFFGVVPGQYVLDVLEIPVLVSDSPSVSISSPGRGAVFSESPSGPPPMQQTLWAAQSVTVDAANLTNVSILLTHGGRISGHFAFVPADDTPPADSIQSIVVTARAVPGTTAARLNVDVGPGPPLTSAVDATSFRTSELVPGDYVLTATGLPQGWVLQSAITRGHDAADEPIAVDMSGISDVVVTLSKRPTDLTGSVTLRDAPASGSAENALAAVIVFPTDRNLWPKDALIPRRLRATTVTSSLTYRVTGLPPGEYFVAATTSAHDFTDPAVLEVLSRSAARVTLVAGETRTQHVDAIRIPVVR